MTVLGVSGQIGYDLAEQAYFHRSLPFSHRAVQARNPRLRATRALVASGAVRINGALTWVGEDVHAYVVRAEESGDLGCTCLWWAKYRGGRGPCKHVLAARMVRDTTKDTENTR